MTRPPPNAAPLTTASGLPDGDPKSFVRAGARGPLLLQAIHLIEKRQHVDSERIAERAVRAKGTGAYGTFTAAIARSKGRRDRARPSLSSPTARLRQWLGWVVFVAGAGLEAGHLAGFVHAAAVA